MKKNILHNNIILNLVGDGSRAANNLLGDHSGRTISRRTGQGLKRGLQLQVNDQEAEDLAHVVMVAIPLFWNSGNKFLKNTSMVLSANLFLAYHKGK